MRIFRLLILLIVFALSGCVETPTEADTLLTCDEGFNIENGECVEDSLEASCENGEILVDYGCVDQDNEDVIESENGTYRYLEVDLNGYEVYWYSSSTGIPDVCIAMYSESIVDPNNLYMIEFLYHCEGHHYAVKVEEEFMFILEAYHLELFSFEQLFTSGVGRLHAVHSTEPIEINEESFASTYPEMINTEDSRFMGNFADYSIYYKKFGVDQVPHEPLLSNFDLSHSTYPSESCVYEHNMIPFVVFKDGNEIPLKDFLELYDGAFELDFVNTFLYGYAHIVKNQDRNDN